MRNLPRSCCAILAAVLLAGAPALAAQAVMREQPAMTCPASQIDIDGVGPPGVGGAAPPVPVTLAEINAAGTNGGGTLAGVEGYDNGVQEGLATYNIRTLFGRGLACATSTASTPGQMLVLDPGGPTVATGAQQYPNASFRLTFEYPSSEFGVQIGDVGGPSTITKLTIGFFRNGSRILTATSSSFTSSTKFFRLEGDCFDRLDLQLESLAQPWLITEIWTPAQVGGVVDPLGIPGCVGSTGARPTQAPSPGTPFPVSCRPYQIDLTGAPGETVAALQIGAPGPYAPFDLGLIGGPPGCPLKIPLSPPPLSLPLATSQAGAASVSLPIPPGLCGMAFATELVLVDPELGLPISATTSNLLEHTVQ